MPDVKLAAMHEAANPAAIAPTLAPFLASEQLPSVAMTRLQAPVCYWALYRVGERRATLKCFFDGQEYERYVAKLSRYYADRVDDPTHSAGGLMVLPEINGVVWGFPFDPGMPDL